VYPYDDRARLLRSESERIKRYLHGLPEDAWGRPSACGQWQVGDVVAHLIGVAEFYAGSVVRGLAGENAPPPGRPPAGQSDGASSAEGIAQRSIAARKSLGDRLLPTYDSADDQLNRLVTGLRPQDREVPCYHPGGLVAAQNFMDLRLKELALHEWDIRAGLEADSRLSAASFPAILENISESIASGSLRWAFWSGPALPAPVRYRFVVTGPGPAKSDLVIDGTTARMEDGASSAPQVTFHCDTEAYLLLVYGRLPLEAAVAAGRLGVEGPAELASRFGQWFRGI
jgi:uncharacterized protein (TIGR03083 family)